MSSFCGQIHHLVSLCCLPFLFEALNRNSFRLINRVHLINLKSYRVYGLPQMLLEDSSCEDDPTHIWMSPYLLRTRHPREQKPLSTETKTIEQLIDRRPPRNLATEQRIKKAQPILFLNAAARRPSYAAVAQEIRINIHPGQLNWSTIVYPILNQ